MIDAGDFCAGLYRLINYGGSMTDNGPELGILPGSVPAADVMIQTSTANQVNLVVHALASPTSFPFWDGGETAENGLIAGGTGTWTATGTNWTTAAATANGAFNAEDLLIFTGPIASEDAQGGAAGRLAPSTLAATASAGVGTVTVDTSTGSISLETGMQFAVTGYTLTGDDIVAKQGGGMLRLTGASFDFDGTASLTEGELAVDGTLGSAQFKLEASVGATLSGAGRIGGALVVNDATVSPGGEPIQRAEQRVAFAAAAAQPANPVGLLTIDGDFSLTSAATLAFQLGDPAGDADVASDLINVGGNLTLDGTLNVVDAGGFGEGLYRLINYGGTLTYNGLAVGETPDGFTHADLTVQTSVANQINLLVGKPVTSFNFWDGANLASDGKVNGGTAIWRADTTNWTIADSTSNGVVDPVQLLVFAGTAGTVTVDNAGGHVRATAGLQFATNGYRIDGGAIALNGATATMRVGDGTTSGAGITAAVASVLTGSASLEKTDLGTLVLSGVNSYSGNTRVLGGTLQIADNAALRTALSAVTLDSDTLQTTAALTSDRRFIIENSVGTIDSGPHALMLSGSFSGTGNLRFAGTGALALSGNSSTLLGNTTLSGGSLALTGSLGGRLSVAAPATLTGTGRAGFLDLSGTFSPGAGSGNAATFTLTGDFVVRAGAKLHIDVAASGAADRVEVGGRALLEGGTVAVTALDPEVNYVDGTIYRIVNATGGFTGTFAGLTESSTFLDFALGYDPTGAFLTTAVIRQFPDVAETFNQIQAATALKDLGRFSGSNALSTYNAILLLGAESARAAFDSTSGEIYPTFLASRQRTGFALAGRIAMRGCASGNEGLALWGGILGDLGHIDGDRNGARSTADNFGWESGVDYRGPDNQ